MATPSDKKKEGGGEGVMKERLNYFRKNHGSSSEDNGGNVEGERRMMKYLLPCLDGAPPFLTPYLLQTCFPPPVSNSSKHTSSGSNDSDRINYLVFGVSIADSCMVPVYADDKKDQEDNVNKDEPATLSKRQQRKAERYEGLQEKQRQERETAAAEADKNNGGKGETPQAQVETEVAKCEKKKPSGYTFKGRSLENYYIIPSSYTTMILPTFDADKTTSISNSTSEGSTIMTSHGRHNLTTDKFLSVVEDLQTASFCVMIYDDAAPYARRRQKLAVERTGVFMDRFLENSDNSQQEKERLAAVPFWAPVVGGASLDLRQKSIERVLKQMFGEGPDSKAGSNRKDVPALRGVALMGIHRCTGTSSSDSLKVEGNDVGAVAENEKKSFCSVLYKCLECLPLSIPVAVVATSGMEQLLDCLLSGVDVVGSDLPLRLAKSYTALSLQIPTAQDLQNTAEDSPPTAKKPRLSSSGADQQEHDKDRSWTMDMSNFRYSRDTRPLIVGCECFACKNHTRAYIQHLVTVKELLGEILLFLHNLHHMLDIFHNMDIALQGQHEGQFVTFLRDQIRNNDSTSTTQP
jgi:queuine/archaeosine tRNA-ribosyltransferase